MFVNADGSFGFFENGLRQNVVFLYHLFRAMPECAGVRLINAGDGPVREDPAVVGVDPRDIVTAETLPEGLDYLINAGAALAPAELRRARDRGVRTIAFKGGNGAVISMEAVVGYQTRVDGERYFDADCYDAVWLTPQHAATYRGWCEAIYRCPVQIAPQTWSPRFVQAFAPSGFGYRRGRPRWRVGILDPNITVMKTSHMPMLAAEAAFRQKPDAFEAIYVTNALRLKDDAHFASFAGSLSAVKARIMTVEPRFIGAQFLADHCEAVVTHQWMNALNYLYWEALYGGYPLVHNSDMLGDAGYRYADFDAADGGRALLEAYAGHDDALSLYREKAAAQLASVDPQSLQVQHRYRELLRTA